MKGNGVGTSNREPQEHSRNIIGIRVYLPGSSYYCYIPTIFLRFPSWGPHFSPFGCVLSPFERLYFRAMKRRLQNDNLVLAFWASRSGASFFLVLPCFGYG